MLTKCSQLVAKRHRVWPPSFARVSSARYAVATNTNYLPAPIIWIWPPQHTGHTHLSFSFHSTGHWNACFSCFPNNLTLQLSLAPLVNKTRDMNERIKQETYRQTNKSESSLVIIFFLNPLNSSRRFSCPGHTLTHGCKVHVLQCRDGRKCFTRNNSAATHYTHRLRLFSRLNTPPFVWRHQPQNEAALGRCSRAAGVLPPSPPFHSLPTTSIHPPRFALSLFAPVVQRPTSAEVGQEREATLDLCELQLPSDLSLFFFFGNFVFESRKGEDIQAFKFIEWLHSRMLHLFLLSTTACQFQSSPLEFWTDASARHVIVLRCRYVVSRGTSWRALSSSFNSHRVIARHITLIAISDLKAGGATRFRSPSILFLAVFFHPFSCSCFFSEEVEDSRVGRMVDWNALESNLLWLIYEERAMEWKSGLLCLSRVIRHSKPLAFQGSIQS